MCEQYVNFNVNSSTTSQKKQAGTQTSTQILSVVIDKMYVSLTRMRSGRLRFYQMQSKALLYSTVDMERDSWRLHIL